MISPIEKSKSITEELMWLILSHFTWTLIAFQIIRVSEQHLSHSALQFLCTFLCTRNSKRSTWKTQRTLDSFKVSASQRLQARRLAWFAILFLWPRSDSKLITKTKINNPSSDTEMFSMEYNKFISMKDSLPSSKVSKQTKYIFKGNV